MLNGHKNTIGNIAKIKRDKKVNKKEPETLMVYLGFPPKHYNCRCAIVKIK